MGWIIGRGIGVPFRLGSSGLGSSYWLTRFPSSPTLTVDSSTQMTVGWTNNGTGHDDITIEQTTDGVTYAVVATATAGSTSQAITGLTAYSLYGFRIRYRKGSSYSAYTNVVFDFTNPLDGDSKFHRIHR